MGEKQTNRRQIMEFGSIWKQKKKKKGIQKIPLE